MPKVYIVQSGDCLASIARMNGFKDWRAIYDHPENEHFRAVRPNPNVIEPGDEIVIPDKTPKTTSVPTGARHTFVVGTAPAHISIELRKFDGAPMSGVKYKLEVADLVVEQTTGSDGRIQHGIYSVATAGTLTIWMPNRSLPYIFDLKIGDLDGLTSDRGIRQRLNNLGFQCGVGDSIDADARLAIRAFQCEHSAEVNGRVADELRNRLLAQHGS